MKLVRHIVKLLTGRKKSFSRTEVHELIMHSGLFDADWYMTQHPEILERSKSALHHYIESGSDKGYWPNPYFDPEWYTGHAPGAKKFQGPAILHYFLEGWKRGKDPSRDFSTTLYLREYPDVAQSGTNPLSHYLQVGQYQNKIAFPRILISKENSEKLISDMRTIAESSMFISEWYIQYYADFWSLKTNTTPIYHYVTDGNRQNRKPNPIFEPQFYRDTYASDIGRMDPFLHYITEGEAKGFMASWHFCPKAYLKKYPELTAKAISPLAHYLRNGFGAGEKPPEPAHRKTSKARKATTSARLPIHDGLRGMIDFEKKALTPPTTTYNPDSLKIHWVIPDFAAGGGGHMTIFRITEYLERCGHKQTIWIHNPTMHGREEDAYDTIVKHFQHFGGKVKFLDKRFQKAKGDIIIATDCWTVWPTLSAERFKKRFYFVQDYEPAFNPVGAFSLAAEQTYKEDLDCICASPWLEQLMREKYGRWARSFWLAADTSIYFPVAKKRANKKPRIAFYARHFTARRAVELGMLALEKLAASGTEFEVDFFGAPLNFTKAPFPFRDHGVASHEQLATIFQQADIGVVFSATNYSLVPQEMMACGLPIVELDGESTQAIFPPETVTLAAPTPQAISMSLQNLIGDPAKRRKQSKAALEWVRGFSWEQAAETIESSLKERLSETFEEKKRASKPTSIISKYGLKASVVIPTLNAGDVLDKVLAATTTQNTPWPYDILVIDSGSTDNTLDIIAQYPSVRLHQIEKKDFNHGGTRNLGAALTTGDFIAFLTHDALPATDRWLYNLVTELERFPDAAGAFGKHLAWPTASAFTKRDLNTHFTGLAGLPLYLTKDTNAFFYENKNQGWRQKLHFYSDNNSCMRRSVWEEIPYRLTKFGEDQLWADDIIAAGYGKAYAPQAIVYHSHDYGPEETYERSFTEAAFFKHFFGYHLIKDEEALENALKGQNTHDEKWGAEHKLSKTEIEVQKTLNESKFKGLFDGYKADTDNMF